METRYQQTLKTNEFEWDRGQKPDPQILTELSFCWSETLSLVFIHLEWLFYPPGCNRSSLTVDHGLLVEKGSWNFWTCRRVFSQTLWVPWEIHNEWHMLRLWYQDTSGTHQWSLQGRAQRLRSRTRKLGSASSRGSLPRMRWEPGPVTLLHCWATEVNWWVRSSWVFRQNADLLLTAWTQSEAFIKFESTTWQSPW